MAHLATASPAEQSAVLPKQWDSTSLGSGLVVTELAFCEYAVPVDDVDGIVTVTVLEAYFVESATLMAETVS
jgi:hypothetical protein